MTNPSVVHPHHSADQSHDLNELHQNQKIPTSSQNSLFHYSPPNLWAIAQDNFPDLITDNKFHFYDPFISPFNLYYFLHQPVGKNNTYSILSFTTTNTLQLIPAPNHLFFHLTSCKPQISIQHSSKSQQIHQPSLTMYQHSKRQTGLRPAHQEFFLSPKYECLQILLQDLVHCFWCKQALVMYTRYFGCNSPIQHYNHHKRNKTG